MNRERILLVLLPVWDPLIPPLGIACLKSYIHTYGYMVRTVDATVDEELREVYNKYFRSLIEFVPENKRRHLYNIGHEVLKNHMMAYLNYEDPEEYVELIKILIFKTFFCDVDEVQVSQLNKIISDFYIKLEKYFIHLLDKERPTVLGLSVYGSTLPASLFAFKLTKEKYPHIQTVMGGGIFSGELALNSPNFNFFLQKTPYIDKIIIGEGEKLFLKYLRGELPKSQRVYTRESIKNEILDLSSATIPDFSDFDPGLYVQMAAYTSRSCPFQCSFCVETIYWGNFRKKKAQKIVNELVEMHKMYGTRLFLMCDSLLNPVITDLADEFKKIDTSLYWGGYLRVDKSVCDVENTLKWRQAGFYRARLGVESGSQRILELMGKKITIQQVKSAVSSLAMAGIKTTVMFVIGYPGETELDFQQTLDLIEELKENIYEADCNPFWYYLTGQVNSDEWSRKKKSVLLYPGKAKEMLILQTWTLDCEPSREETYRRVNRFVQHCAKLKVPNPYSLQESNRADERWQQLHKNAVPSLLKIKSKNICIDECKNVKNLSYATFVPQDNSDWDF
ncbi:MAG: radical SAM protein [Candidatus Aminicenantes bacterium]